MLSNYNMIRMTLAAVLSLLYPGLGDLIINFQLIKGTLIMLGYILIVFAVLSTPYGVLALIVLIPIFHIISSISALAYYY